MRTSRGPLLPATLLIACLAALAPATGGQTAAAQGPAAGVLEDGYIPWPSLLPGRTVGPAGPPRDVPRCHALDLGCVDRLMRRLRAEWRTHDASCDHRAIFSLGYLRITGEIRRRLEARRTFRHRRWFIGVVQGFSNLYFSTGKRYASGRPVPESWRIYYDAMDQGDFNAGQDLLLASNAHTNHDLPYAYAASGLLNRRSVSRKPDHDAINEVNAGVFDGLSAYYAKHYDPFFSTTNLASPLDQLTSLQVVQMWRENAWRQAERLVDARSRAELQAVQRDIEATSAAWARLITLGAEPGHREVRDAYCASR